MASIDGKSGISLEWPIIAVMLTVMISMVTGAIQLGAVQTHVAINTTRMDMSEERERKLVQTDNQTLERIARTEVRMDLGEKSLDRAASDLSTRLTKIETQLDLLLKKVP